MARIGLRQQLRIAGRPDHHRAPRPQVAEVDPRRPRRAAVDQHARMLRRIMGDVAALPHRPDHIGQRLAGHGAIAARHLGAEPLAGIQHRGVAR